MEKDPSLEALAKDFYSFLKDTKKYGRSYPANRTLDTSIVTYSAVGYNIRVEFNEKHSCNVEITGPLSLEELISIPYESENKPNWPEFFKGIFTLIKERQNR